MSTAANSSVWTPEVELALFMAMVGLRPVGIHRHFRLVNIYTRFVNRIGSTDLSLSDLKQHLDGLYDIKLLDEIGAEDDEANSQETDPENRVTKTSAKVGSHANEDADGGGSEESNKPGENSTDPNVQDAPASSTDAIDVSDPQFWRKSDAEFTLPWAEFGALMVERAGVNDADDDVEVSSASVSPGSTPKEATREATPEATPEPVSSDGHPSPVQKRRRGRSATPVPRSRTKAPASTPVPAPVAATTRSAAPSTRKRPKKN
ncbi:hypothetical protein H4S07_005008 [Coemansia furcata]|uniref:Uncharacterized protein n=1 Tax=Coemansia furcata TaxID=417177 RepID=A0ACC1L5H7_9FUNG|nr:hypothetical protein H4S07_005008 [Coemansia furcata]